MEFSFTSKTGKNFTAIFSHNVRGTTWFSVNGVEGKMTENHPGKGKCIVFGMIGRKEFLATMGMDWAKVGKPDCVAIQIQDADYAAMMKYANKMLQEAARVHQVYMDSLPVQYRLSYDGINADGDKVATKVIIDAFKAYGQGQEEIIITQKWPASFFPVSEAQKLAGNSGWENGWYWVELNEEKKNELAASFAEKAQAKREAEKGEIEKNDTGFQIEYHGDHEIWNGIRMD